MDECTIPLFTLVEDIRDVYSSFARYLDRSYPGEFSFLCCDYDDIISPLIDYIVEHGYSPPDRLFYGDEYFDAEDCLPAKLVNETARFSGLRAEDIDYMAALLANRINNIPEVLMDKYQGCTGGDCKVSVQKVSHGYWMFRTVKY